MLALVLPFRGALANVASCAGGPIGFDGVAALVHHDAGVAHVHQAHGHDHDHASSAPDGSKATSSSTDKCNVCTAACSATPFMSAALLVLSPTVVADAAFPALHAPSPSHASEGPERPPRTI